MTTNVIAQAEILLELFDSHDVIKKAYKDSYLIRRSQLVDAITQAKDETNYICELEAMLEDCPYCIEKAQELIQKRGR